MSSAIKDLGNALEGFLPGCVPDLQFKDSVLHLKEKGAELHTNSNLMILTELVGRHSMHQTGFTHT